jgi:hypothetical protein
MEATSYLRRQAAFYLRLSKLCCDDAIADQLRFHAADCHERALRAEFDLRPVRAGSASSLH